MTEIPGEAVPQLAGVRVSNIEPGMPQYGTVEGAMVTRINREFSRRQNRPAPGRRALRRQPQRVHSVAELLAVPARRPERPLRIFLLRGDSRLTLTLR